MPSEPRRTKVADFAAFGHPGLGSFGTQQLVGNSLMPQCADPSGCTLETDGIEGKMLGQEVVKGAYAYDYTIEQTGKTPRHLRTLFAVQTEEGRGRRLVTLTAQCYESKYAELKPLFQKVLESYSTSLK